MIIATDMILNIDMVTDIIGGFKLSLGVTVDVLDCKTCK